MSITRAEILLHPVRMRILQVVSGVGPCTARQIADVLDDIPTASLYRHLGHLVEAGVLAVTDERPVRGSVEKTYDLPSGALLSPEESQDASAEVHFRSFLGFAAGQLANLSRYLEQGVPDLAADGVTYQTFPLHLSDAEYAALLDQLRELLRRALAQSPGAGRRLRLVSLSAMPAVDDPAEDIP